MPEVPGGRRNLKGGGVTNVKRVYDRIWTEAGSGSGMTSTRSVRVKRVGLAVTAEEGDAKRRGEAERLAAELDAARDKSTGCTSLQHGS